MLTRDIPVDEMILYQPLSLNDRSRELPFQLPGAGADGIRLMPGQREASPDQREVRAGRRWRPVRGDERGAGDG